MYKISVIIPTYNVEPFLVECMESVTRQTLKEVEIICVNDGSTDNSLEILQDYAKKDDRIVIITGPNAGYGSAMNKGLDKATGEYIAIVEPDDYISLTMYEDLYAIAKENDLDFVKADFFRFTTENNGNRRLIYNRLSGDEESYNIVVTPGDKQETFKYIMNTWSGIYNRTFLEENKIRHHETPGASFQDNGFWFQTFCFAKKAMFVNKTYYNNRRDNVNSSVSNPDKVYCMNEEYDYIRRYLENNEGFWEKYSDIYFWRRYQNCIATIRRIAWEHKHKYVQDISQEFTEFYEKDKMSKEKFSPAAWSDLMFLIKDPEGFYAKKVLQDLTASNLQRHVNNIENSTTYKVGKIIMFIPCTIKRFLRRS